MNRKVTRLILCIFLFFSMPITANGQTTKNSDLEILNTKLNHIISGKGISRVYGSARGRILSSVGLQLSDEGNGVIGVYAETLCHKGVEEIYMVIYLDIWDERIQDWITINDYEYIWKSSEYPDKDLTDVSVSFLVEDLSRGRTYSLRASHLVTGFDSSSEMMFSETDGIVLN